MLPFLQLGYTFLQLDILRPSNQASCRIVTTARKHKGVKLEINIKENPELSDIKLIIECPKIDVRVQKLISAANMLNHKIVGSINGVSKVIPLSDVFYFETVDGKSFAYTKDDVLEVTSTLQELESELIGSEFVRVSRQMIVNLAFVTGIRPYLNARLELILQNDEHVIVSRQYAPDIKKRIGLS